MPPSNLVLADELGHNTAANPTYDKAHFAGNFTGAGGANPALADDSNNPITPSHVSGESVRSLFPGLTVPIVVLTTPYNYGGNHRDFGIKLTDPAWAKDYCEDMQRRGVSGIVIDWYGPGNIEDQISLLLKKQCESMTGFTFSLMIDSTGDAPKTTSTLQAAMAYAKTAYFPSPAYRKLANGKCVIYPWGQPLAGVDYNAVFSAAGVPLYKIFQGPGAIGNPLADGGFDWVQPWTATVPTDRYNLAAKQSFINSFKGQSKGCVLAVSPGFRDTLASWGKNRILPRDFGKCWLAQCALVAKNLLPNLIEIMMATGTDQEEGTALMYPIDNGITVGASLSGSILKWGITGGSETTISYYRILAVAQGSTAAGEIGRIPTGNAGGTFDLSGITDWQPTVTYQVCVIAVGKPCIKNQVSEPVTYTAAATSITGTFSGTFMGTFKGTFKAGA